MSARRLAGRVTSRRLPQQWGCSALLKSLPAEITPATFGRHELRNIKQLTINTSHNTFHSEYQSRSALRLHATHSIILKIAAAALNAFEGRNSILFAAVLLVANEHQALPTNIIAHSSSLQHRTDNHLSHQNLHYHERPLRNRKHVCST
jgi:hypothetical protein